MKCARIAAALAALLLCLTGAQALADVPAKPGEFAYAYDFSGGVLSQSDIDAIGETGAALEDATGIQAVAVVVDFWDGMDAADYATDLINAWGIGSEDEDDGVVVLLARGEREIQIGTGRGVDRVMTGAACGELIDQNIDAFADGAYSRGMRELYEDVCQYLARAEGKTLSPAAQTSGASNASARETAPRETRASGGPGFFDILIGLLFAYLVISILVNALMPKGDGCMRYLFLGWLLRGNQNGRRRPPSPPTPPMGGGFGGGFGAPRTPRTPPRTYTRGSFGGTRSFGGGSSRGGGAGRSFGGGLGGSRGLGGGAPRSGGFGGSRGFGGGSSRGGGGGRKF